MPISPFTVGSGPERELEIAFLAENLPLVRGLALDIGCAGAGYLQMLSERQILIGVDPRHCRECPREMLPLRGIWGQMADVDLVSAFSLVTCISTLDHVGLDAYGVSVEVSLEDFAHDVFLALRPDGLFVLTVPVGESQVAAHPGGGQRVFSREEIAGLFPDDRWEVQVEEYWKLERDDRYVKRTWAKVQKAAYADYRAEAVGMWILRKR